MIWENIYKYFLKRTFNQYRLKASKSQQPYTNHYTCIIDRIYWTELELMFVILNELLGVCICLHGWTQSIVRYIANF